MSKKQIMLLENTDSFIVFIKTEEIYIDIGKDVETRFDTSNRELERPLPRRETKKLINERRIRWKNNERVCRIETKNTAIQEIMMKIKKNKQTNGTQKSVSYKET